MNKKILFLILFGILVFPVMADAQVTIGGIITNIVNNVAWPIAIGAVIIFWIATGVLFLASLGDPSKLKLAKVSLIASLVGTVVIILAGSACGIIANSLGLPLDICP